MTFYQNINEYHCGISDMESPTALCTDQNDFMQNPANYQVPPNIYTCENYPQMEAVSVLTAESNRGDFTQGELTCRNQFYDTSSHPPYLSIQYTPMTPESVSYPVFQLHQTQPYQNSNFMSKKHRAQIIIMPTSKDNFKAVVKRKRKRTVFTTKQIETLEEIFKTKQYITREERQDLVEKLQLKDKAVKIWFQNRRLKTKRISDQCLEKPEDAANIRLSVEDSHSSPDIARLDFVESQISKKTDEFGYVSLDDGVMGDLANIIDIVLTKNNLDVPVEETMGSNSSPIYEPISPASTSDSNEEESSSCWRPSEPNESLQRLFDLQTMFSL